MSTDKAEELRYSDAGELVWTDAEEVDAQAADAEHVTQGGRLDRA